MGEIGLDHCCRLCLKEGFSLTNIFSNRSAAGDPLYRILNFIYEMKIIENDGLPSEICSPCMWRMIEFEACKKNVRSAEAEIMRLLNQSRPCPEEPQNNTLLTKAEVTEMGGASEVGMECDTIHSEVPIKEELDFVESERPIGTVMEYQIPESIQQFKEDGYHELKSEEQSTGSSGLKNLISLEASVETVGNTFEGERSSICSSPSDSTHSVHINEEVEIMEWHKPEELKREAIDIWGNEIESVLQNDPNKIIDCASVSSKVILQGIDLKLKKEGSQLTIDIGDTVQSTVSSESKNCLSLEASEATVVNSFEGESSSICTSQDIYDKKWDTNQGMPENDLRYAVTAVEESLSTQISKSIRNATKSGRSNLKAPLSKRKIGFICDICNKSFQYKAYLGKHVRVHYDDRPYSCSVCDKRFKQDEVRYRHELLHLRHKMSSGKSEKGSKKKLFSCSICEKKFSSKRRLNDHSNTHSYKFKCNFCGKCFGNNTRLSIHSRIHTNDKPFKCEVCLKCFSDKSNFKRHLLIHSLEKPHTCDICDKRFKSKGEKTQHALYHLRKK